MEKVKGVRKRIKERENLKKGIGKRELGMRKREQR